MRRDKRYWFNLLRLFLAGLLSAISLIIVGLAYLCASVFAHPIRIPLGLTPAWYDLPYEEVRFLSADGLSLSGWYIPSQNGAAVIFCHGWNGNRNLGLGRAVGLARHGYGALLFDFRAHGQSEGRVCSLGPAEVDDLLGAIEYLKTRSDIDAGRIGVLGLSMGGAVAILTAARSQDLRAIVVEGPYASQVSRPRPRRVSDVPDFLMGYLCKKFIEWKAGISYSAARPVDKVGAISPRPVLFIYGTDIEGGRQLYEAARQPKELWHIPEAPHLGGFAARPEEYAAKILTFYDQALTALRDR